MLLSSDAGLGDVADRLVDQARSDGLALTGEDGLLTGLIQRVVQGAMEAEITIISAMRHTRSKAVGQEILATAITRKRCALK